MECRGDDSPPVFLMKRRIGVHNYIHVLFAVSKIWFGVDSNARTTSKKIPHGQQSFKKSKQRNGTEYEDKSEALGVLWILQ